MVTLRMCGDPHFPYLCCHQNLSQGPGEITEKSVNECELSLSLKLLMVLQSHYSPHSHPFRNFKVIFFLNSIAPSIAPLLILCLTYTPLSLDIAGFPQILGAFFVLQTQLSNLSEKYILLQIIWLFLIVRAWGRHSGFILAKQNANFEKQKNKVYEQGREYFLTSIQRYF